MFSGIIETQGTITLLKPQASGLRLHIKPKAWGPAPAEGDSIAVNGCCLTHNTRVSVPQGEFGFDVITESLNKTTLGELKLGSTVNLEPALTLDRGLHGHIVQGHIDGMGEIIKTTTDSDWYTITIRQPEELTPYLVPKGSIAINGISLTIADTKPDQHLFSVALIPTTLSITTLGDAQVGDQVNLETDIIAKTVVHWLSLQQSQGKAISMDLLKDAGYMS